MPQARAAADAVPRSMTSSSIETIWNAVSGEMHALGMRRVVVGGTPVRVDDADDSARTDGKAAVRKHRERGGQIERRDHAGAERERRHVGQIAQAGARTRAAAPDAIRPAAAATVAARLFDSISAARSVSASGGFPARRCAAPIRRVPAAGSSTSPLEHRHRREAVLERGRKEERLERRSGLPPAADGAIELRLPEIAAADEREDVAGARIDGDERRLQLRLVEPAQPVRHGALGRVLQLRHERRAHLPVRRMIAAELVAELLAQELLRVAAARIGRAWVTAQCGSASRAPRAPAPR